MELTIHQWQLLWLVQPPPTCSPKSEVTLMMDGTTSLVTVSLLVSYGRISVSLLMTEHHFVLIPTSDYPNSRLSQLSIIPTLDYPNSRLSQLSTPDYPNSRLSQPHRQSNQSTVAQSTLSRELFWGLCLDVLPVSSRRVT